jgi:adenylate cyclase
MSDQAPQRRLAAILAADVVGYSRLMQTDEAGTLAALKDRRSKILQPLVAKHRGRIVKVMGDGVLIEFASAVNAVSCAVDLQEAMGAANADLPEDRQIVLRIGVNLGDVVVEGSDLYGDGVNIAARLEALSEPGAVLVSGKVHQEVAGKVDLTFDDLGEQSLKNMAKSVPIYRVFGVAPQGPAASLNKTARPEKPSIAVLPFTNMSGDPEQEYFSDGITEDIITDLSQASDLFVVARNTTFALKGKPVDVPQAARKLNVEYILEGSVRKVGSRVRITAQLADGATGGHLWAQRYDREFGDVFAIQDEITKNVVIALKAKLLRNKPGSSQARSTANPEAYELYLRARSTFRDHPDSRRAIRSAWQLFAGATQVDPGYARAYAGMADCEAKLWFLGDPDVSQELILARSSKALELMPNLAEAHASRGFALSLSGPSPEAAAEFKRAIELNPDLYEAHLWYAEDCRVTDDFDKAIMLLKHAAQLEPRDFIALGHLSQIYALRGDRYQYLSTLKHLLTRVEEALYRNPDDAHAIGFGASCLVELGESARAEQWAARSISLEPDEFNVRYNAACTYAILGQYETALDNLEYIYLHLPRSRQWLMGYIKSDAQLNSLRGRADFQAFIKRLEVTAVPAAMT